MSLDLRLRIGKDASIRENKVGPPLWRPDLLRRASLKHVQGVSCGSNLAEKVTIEERTGSHHFFDEVLVSTETNYIPIVSSSASWKQDNGQRISCLKHVSQKKQERGL